jgi:hypothetical protein
MKKILITVILLMSSAVAQTYEVAISVEKAGWGNHLSSLMFLDPLTRDVLATHILGVHPALLTVNGQVDSDGEYFYATVPAKGRKSWSLLVFNIDTHEEIAFLPIGSRLDKYQQPTPVFFNGVSDDGKRFVTLVQRRNWQLDVYERPSFKLLGTSPEFKNVSTVEYVGNRQLVITSSTKYGKEVAFHLLNIESQEVITTQHFENGTKLEIIPDVAKGEFLVIAAQEVTLGRDAKTKRVKSGHSVTLHKIDAQTGLELEKVKLGYAATKFYVDDTNQYNYLATRKTLTEQGVTVWRAGKGQIEQLIETDLHYNPSLTLVSEKHGIATVFCEKRILVFDLEDHSLKHDIPLPFVATSGFFSKDANKVFFRETGGSEVGAIDLQRGELIGDSPTGRRGVKAGLAVLSIASVTADIYLSFIAPYPLFLIPSPVFIFPIDTQMMTDPAEKYLYVINQQTNDLTVFSAGDFERLDTIPIKQPFALHRFSGSQNLYVMGLHELSVIGPGDHLPFNRYRDGNFAGLDLQQGVAYFANDEALQIIDIDTGQLISRHPELKNVTQVFTRQSN